MAKTSSATPVEPWWVTEGYLAGKQILWSPDERVFPKNIGTGLWICLAKMITTYRVMLCTPEQVHEFWCYPHSLGLDHARRAFDLYEGKGDPIDGWVKHFPSGRRYPHPDEVRP